VVSPYRLRRLRGPEPFISMAFARQHPAGHELNPVMSTSPVICFGQQPCGFFPKRFLVSKIQTARRLQKELETRGIPVVLTRVADNLLTWDQRAVSANTSHTSLYVAIHSSSSGHGVRLYTALLSASEPAAAQNPRAFLPWELAQAPYLSQSRASAAVLAEACTAAGVLVRTSSAPLRPLNSITIAAVAVEVAPSGSAVEELSSSDYQQKVAAAIASGIVALRGKLGDTQ